MGSDAGIIAGSLLQYGVGMPNGKPGDNPISGRAFSPSPVFTERAESLIREIHALGGMHALDAVEDELFRVSLAMEELELTLEEHAARLRPG